MNERNTENIVRKHFSQGSLDTTDQVLIMGREL